MELKFKNEDDFKKKLRLFKKLFFPVYIVFDEKLLGKEDGEGADNYMLELKKDISELQIKKMIIEDLDPNLLKLFESLS